MAHYMVVFRDICRVNCKKIHRNAVASEGTKILQLAVQTRQELRDRLVVCFGRIPAEHQI
jgi:hypothetical protein